MVHSFTKQFTADLNSVMFMTAASWAACQWDIDALSTDEARGQTLICFLIVKQR